MEGIKNKMIVISGASIRGRRYPRLLIYVLRRLRRQSA
jgi:hypothetical protein